MWLEVYRVNVHDLTLLKFRNYVIAQIWKSGKKGKILRLNLVSTICKGQGFLGNHSAEESEGFKLEL